uniref:paralemmin 1a isoform X2 n=1 Tax=Solea senegalensis TaxID=28829 RepID=UPI001CD8C9B8|nr:paralemmin 1a isoform X2 [Solea senegalensis]
MMMMQETQDRLQLITEKKKLQTEVENKRHQLEDDRRTLQYLKSKTLRERWLLDGAPSAGPDQNQDQVQRQVEQDEAKTRILEETISRLEQELVSLEIEDECQTITLPVATGSVKEVRGQGAPCPTVHEVKIHTSPQINTPRESTEMKRGKSAKKRDLVLHHRQGQDQNQDQEQRFRTLFKTRIGSKTNNRTPRSGARPGQAVYSVEITVERDRLTGETRVLSTNTTLPVDLSQQGIKVYEDEQKVVHEVNGEDGVHLLSCSEVDELIHKADEASMMSQTVATVNSLSTAELQEEAGPELQRSQSQVTVEIVGLEAKPPTELDVSEASAEKPVTMVFMGYQSVEDEAETKRVLGLHGTVTAELVVIDDANGKMSPGGHVEQEARRGAQTEALPPLTSSASSASPPSAKPTAAMMASNGETTAREAECEAGRETGGVVEVKKKKQPCMCCSIM